MHDRDGNADGRFHASVERYQAKLITVSFSKFTPIARVRIFSNALISSSVKQEEDGSAVATLASLLAARAAPHRRTRLNRLMPSWLP